MVTATRNRLREITPLREDAALLDNRGPMPTGPKPGTENQTQAGWGVIREAIRALLTAAVGSDDMDERTMLKTIMEIINAGKAVLNVSKPASPVTESRRRLQTARLVEAHEPYSKELLDKALTGKAPLFGSQSLPASLPLTESRRPAVAAPVAAYSKEMLHAALSGRGMDCSPPLFNAPSRAQAAAARRRKDNELMESSMHLSSYSKESLIAALR